MTLEKHVDFLKTLMSPRKHDVHFWWCFRVEYISFVSFKAQKFCQQSLLWASFNNAWFRNDAEPSLGGKNDGMFWTTSAEPLMCQSNQLCVLCPFGDRMKYPFFWSEWTCRPAQGVKISKSDRKDVPNCFFLPLISDHNPGFWVDTGAHTNY